ncbi:MAG: hypothetical protein AAF745_14280 [Planctomycetota bacterium]
MQTALDGIHFRMHLQPYCIKLYEICSAAPQNASSDEIGDVATLDS